MLKRRLFNNKLAIRIQPPSGGCVLKHFLNHPHYHQHYPAAFRRLCVETITRFFGRIHKQDQPPSGGCVLKLLQTPKKSNR